MRSITDRSLFTRSIAWPIAVRYSLFSLSRWKSQRSPLRAHHSCVHSGSGTTTATMYGLRSPKIIAWLISGCSVSMPSTFCGATLSPLSLTMMSFLRSVILIRPAVSISPMSPVCSQSSLSTRAVSTGLCQ